MDIIINFNSAFLNESYLTIDDRKVIVCNYLKGWFLFDLLAVFPFGLILLLIPEENNESPTHAHLE